MKKSTFSKDLFAGTAEYYAKYRVPYPNKYINNIIEAAKPDKAGRLLDLGSGPGRAAIPLSRYFKRVIAVDQEKEMIKVGRQICRQNKIANISWKAVAVESISIPPNSIEMITIGEAFHRMDQDLVAKNALKWLKPGGYLVLMGCSNIWNGKEPWQLMAREIINKWAKKGKFKQVPYTLVLEKAGFTDVKTFQFYFKHTWSLDELVGYLYSTSMLSKRILGKKAGEFEDEFRQAMLSCDSSGQYSERIMFYYDLAKELN